jgi:hypothetical protein
MKERQVDWKPLIIVARMQRSGMRVNLYPAHTLGKYGFFYINPAQYA